MDRLIDRSTDPSPIGTASLEDPDILGNCLGCCGREPSIGWGWSVLLAQMATESSLSPYFAEVEMRCGDMKRHDLFHSELVEEPVKTR